MKPSIVVNCSFNRGREMGIFDIPYQIKLIETKSKKEKQSI